MPDMTPSDLAHDARRLRLDTLVRLRWLAVAGQSAGRGRRAFRPRLPAAVRLVLRSSSRSRPALNLAPAHPLPGEPPPQRRRGDPAARLRHPAARRPALPHRRAAEPVRHAVSRAGADLRDGAAAGAHARRSACSPSARPRCSFSSTGRCRGRRARRSSCPSSTSPASGRRSCSAPPSPASTPGGWPRRRASSPRRSPRPSWCSPASSTCPSSTASPPPPRTSSARRSPPSRSSPRSSTTRCRRSGAGRRGHQAPARAGRALPRHPGEAHLARPGRRPASSRRMTLSHLVEEVVAPQRSPRASTITVERDGRGAGAGLPPQSRRPLRPRQHPRQRRGFRRRAGSTVEARWTPDEVRLEIRDDGPGFAPEVLLRVGEPYVTTRGRRTGAASDEGGGGLRARPVHRQDPDRALGRPARRSSNAPPPATGAVVRIVWPRAAFERGVGSRAAGAPRGRAPDGRRKRFLYKA